ncbi:hypothetical protein M378DRAFT_87861, partial [Amanita muscaria Koide BX008]
TAQLQQTSVDSHFQPVLPGMKPQPYSDKLMKEAAIEWLIRTNQPISAFENPAFKRMTDIAARATHGIKLLSQKQTRAEIIGMFQEQMLCLRDRLNVALYHTILCVFSSDHPSIRDQR